MRDRRMPVLTGSVCVAVIAFFASLPGVRLFAQQADPPQMAVPGQAVPGRAQATIDQWQANLNKAEADGDGTRQAVALLAIGEQYWMTGDSQTAMEKFSRALPIMQRLGLKQGEAMVLTDMGGACRDASKELKALEYDNQALALYRELGNRVGESMVLSNMAIVYYDLGENQKAQEYGNQALAMFVEQADRANEALELNNLGRLYYEMGQGDKSEELLNRAIPLLQQTGVRVVEGRAEKNLGNVYRDRGDMEKALDAYGKALAIMNEMGDRAGQAMTLDDMGSLHARRGEAQEARDSYKKALAIAVSMSETLQEALVYSDLMHLEKSSAPELATYYGQQAVNLLQQVRGDIRTMDKELQKSFLTSKADYYRDLAYVLIEQGRLPEAQQVLDLLKQEEYQEYVRGEATDALSPLALTPAERQAEEEYQKSTAQLVSLGEQWEQLRQNTARTPEQDKQLDDLTAQLSKASEGLDVFYARLYLLFGKTNNANHQVADVKGHVSSLKQILAELQHTVALYTLVGKDRTSIIVITGSEDVPAVVRESTISEGDLNRKIAAFQEVLRHPGQDPKPLAQDLYKILIGPVKSDLDQAKATTLVWSLDGMLRYVPMAALYDGKQNVVENYNTATISPASFDHLAEPPGMSKITTVAMGISQKYEEGLSALPAVVGELDDVVKDAKVPGADGALTGTILLNGQFTKKAMENQFVGYPTVVHIASHFVYNPGEADKSYLLLGGAPFHL